MCYSDLLNDEVYSNLLYSKAVIYFPLFNVKTHLYKLFFWITQTVVCILYNYKSVDQPSFVVYKWTMNHSAIYIKSFKSYNIFADIQTTAS